MSGIGQKTKTIELLKKYNLSAKKKYGQNFLTDQNILKKIVNKAKINKQTLVVEIGPGLGALTEHLLQKSGHVLAYEIDNDLKPLLNELFLNEAFTLINGDILKQNVDEDITKLDKQYSRVILVANLPYYITTPIIMKLLEESSLIEEYYVMMQYEVAMRFTSKPSTKDYNALSVLIQYKTDSSIIMKVPRQVFVPSPNVDSAIVKIVVKKNKNKKPQNEKQFYKIVKSAFHMRRKTLANNLFSILHLTKKEIQDDLVLLGFKPTIRAEELTVEDFIKIADHYNCK